MYIYIYIFFFLFFLFFLFFSFFFFWHVETRCIERLLHAKYHMTTSEFVGILKSCLSMSAKIKAPPKKAFFTIYGPRKLGQTFLYDQAWPSCASSRLDSSSKTLGLTFLLDAWSTRRRYNCPWHIVVMRFSSIMFNCSYRERAHSASNSSVWDKILRDRISTFVGRMASLPYTNEYGSHQWKYEQKCDMHTKQTTSSRANPCMCLSSLPIFSLCSC